MCLIKKKSGGAENIIIISVENKLDMFAFEKSMNIFLFVHCSINRYSKRNYLITCMSQLLVEKRVGG